MKRDSKGKPAKRITKQNDRPKRSSDPNLLAHQLIRETTEKLEGSQVTDDEVSRVMAALGRKGGRIGGKRRLDTLTQERRSQIAFKAAQARWGKKTKAKKP
jgi:hypothetical protein